MKLQSSPHKSNTPKLLLIVRHGEAAPRNIGLSDFERALTEKGAKECHYVGKALYKKKLTVDLMVSSPADRALETAHIFAPYLKYAILKIKINAILYNSETLPSVVKEIQKLDDGLNSVAIFGHNPIFDNLAAYFIPKFQATIPKGAVVAVEFQVDSWAKIDRASGELEFMITPSGTNRLIPAKKY